MKKLLLCSDKYYARAVPIFVKGPKRGLEPDFGEPGDSMQG